MGELGSGPVRPFNGGTAPRILTTSVPILSNVQRQQLAVLGVVGASGVLAIVGYVHGSMWDAAQLYIAGRALLAGHDPYAAVAASSFPWPLFYPLPAVLLFLPFACLPIEAARVAWAMVQGLLLGLGARRHGPTL